jgi:flagellar assembly factor FliW
MQIQTTRFGVLDVEDSGLITFPDGLPGFEGHRKFAFVPHRSPNHDKTSPFKWLQSVEDGSLAFLTAEPRPFFPEYTPELSRNDLEALALANDDLEPRMYTLLTVPPGDPCGITANLMAPVVINPVAQVGRQVILAGDHYGLRHRLVPEGAA